MMREQRYLRWLAACGIGAGALVGVAGLAGSDAVPSASRSVVVAPACNGTTWTTAHGARVCLQSAPFAVDPRVLRRFAPFEARPLTAAEVGRLPAGMSAFRFGASKLQIDRPCQDENATF